MDFKTASKIILDVLGSEGYVLPFKKLKTLSNGGDYILASMNAADLVLIDSAFASAKILIPEKVNPDLCEAVGVFE